MLKQAFGREGEEVYFGDRLSDADWARCREWGSYVCQRRVDVPPLDGRREHRRRARRRRPCGRPWGASPPAGGGPATTPAWGRPITTASARYVPTLVARARAPPRPPRGGCRARSAGDPRCTSIDLDRSADEAPLERRQPAHGATAAPAGRAPRPDARSEPGGVRGRPGRPRPGRRHLLLGGGQPPGQLRLRLRRGHRRAALHLALDLPRRRLPGGELGGRLVALHRARDPPPGQSRATPTWWGSDGALEQFEARVRNDTVARRSRPGASSRAGATGSPRPARWRSPATATPPASPPGSASSPTAEENVYFSLVAARRTRRPGCSASGRATSASASGGPSPSRTWTGSTTAPEPGTRPALPAGLAAPPAALTRRCWRRRSGPAPGRTPRP